MDPVVVLDDIYNIPNYRPHTDFVPDRIGWAMDLTLKGISNRIYHGFTPSWMANRQSDILTKGKALLGKVTTWGHKIDKIWDNLNGLNDNWEFLEGDSDDFNTIGNSHCA